jgi:hypothetical protein
MHMLRGGILVPFMPDMMIGHAPDIMDELIESKDAVTGPIHIEFDTSSLMFFDELEKDLAYLEVSEQADLADNCLVDRRRRDREQPFRTELMLFDDEAEFLEQGAQEPLYWRLVVKTSPEQ